MKVEVAVLGSPSRILYNPFTAMISFENDPQKCAQFEILKPFFFFFFFLFFLFALPFERIFTKTHSVESRCVIGPENILFAGVCAHFSARKFYRLGQ